MQQEKCKGNMLKTYKQWIWYSNFPIYKNSNILSNCGQYSNQVREKINNSLIEGGTNRSQGMNDVYWIFSLILTDLSIEYNIPQ